MTREGYDGRLRFNQSSQDERGFKDAVIRMQLGGSTPHIWSLKQCRREKKSIPYDSEKVTRFSIHFQQIARVH